MSLSKVEARAAFAELQKLPANRECIDCSRVNPQWASVSNGVFVCIECSGIHRSLGVHISFVRSVTMDSWSKTQMKMMTTGGNQRIADFWQQQRFPSDISISDKYGCDAMIAFRSFLKSVSNGENVAEPKFIGYQPPVTQRPVAQSYTNDTSIRSSASSYGYGSTTQSQQAGVWDSLSSSINRGVTDLRQNDIGEQLVNAGSKGWGALTGFMASAATSVQDLAAQAQSSMSINDRPFALGNRPPSTYPSLSSSSFHQSNEIDSQSHMAHRRTPSTMASLSSSTYFGTKDADASTQSSMTTSRPASTMSSLSSIAFFNSASQNTTSADSSAPSSKFSAQPTSSNQQTDTMPSRSPPIVTPPTQDQGASTTTTSSSTSATAAKKNRIRATSDEWNDDDWGWGDE